MSDRVSTKRRGRPQPRRRLAGEDRRRELVRAAAELLTRRGLDGVQFPEVAAAAGVTRQLVYRFFPSRRALVLAVLEDFADDLARRFGRSAALALPQTIEDATRIFVDAACDTIEAKGAGPWGLLDWKGPDPAVAARAGILLDDLLAPWRARVAEGTGAPDRHVAVVMRMIVAAGRMALEPWHSGRGSRAEAVHNATRGVSALLAALAEPPPGARRRR